MNKVIKEMNGENSFVRDGIQPSTFPSLRAAPAHHGHPVLMKNNPTLKKLRRLLLAGLPALALAVAGCKAAVSVSGSFATPAQTVTGTVQTTTNALSVTADSITNTGNYIENASVALLGPTTNSAAALIDTFNDGTNASIVGGTSGVTNTSTKYGACVVAAATGIYSNFDSGGNFLLTNSSVSGQQVWPVGPGAGVTSKNASIISCKIIFQ